MAAHPPVEGRVLLPLLWSSSEGRASRPGYVGRSVRRLSVRKAARVLSGGPAPHYGNAQAEALQVSDVRR